MRRPNLRRGALAPTLGSGLVLAVAVGAALPAAPATAGPPAVVSAPTAISLSAGGAEEYWTPERLADARPLDLREGDDDDPEAGSSDPSLLRSAVTPLRATIVKRPASYPNRVHGKIFGTFPGLGDFTCSGTVVTSKSGSLVTTAAHCVYDAGRGRSNQFASQLAFVPGYSSGNAPYGVFGATNAIVPGQWVRFASLDYDLAMLRIGPEGGQTVQKAVGSRGIGFDQKRRQRLSAYGYPGRGGKPAYNGERLAKCTAGYIPDPFRYGGPRSRGMRCDQQQGASGGGWVSQQSFVVSNTSHGYPRRSNNKFYGPHYGAVAKSLYRANGGGWSSIGPIRCRGQVVSIAGTSRGETIRGSKGKDVIATLGGNDRILGGNERDLICGGTGTDRILGGGGDDRIDGGAGADRCDGARGKDGMRGCEVRRGG